MNALAARRAMFGIVLAGAVGAGPSMAATVLPAHQTASLVGLQRGADGSRTDLQVENRAAVPASCELTLVRADGSLVGEARAIDVAAKSSFVMTDALASEATIQDVRALVRCDQEFSAAAVITTPTERRVVGAAQELVQTKDLPTCGAGNVCYDYPGAIFTSTPQKTADFITLTPPAATYSAVKVHLEVQINAFSRPSAAAHGLLYMVRDKNKDMFASAFLRGPHTNVFTLRHGFDQLSADKAKLTVPFTPVLTNTYALDYLYDTAGKTLVMTLKGPNGQQVARVSDVPNVASVVFGKGDFILISLSNSGVHNGKPNPQEPASLSWMYSNFHVELVPQTPPPTAP